MPQINEKERSNVNQQRQRMKSTNLVETMKPQGESLLAQAEKNGGIPVPVKMKPLAMKNMVNEIM